MTEYFLPLNIDFQFKPSIPQAHINHLSQNFHQFQFTQDGFQFSKEDWVEYQNIFNEIREINKYCQTRRPHIRIIGGMIGKLGRKDEDGMFHAKEDLKIVCQKKEPVEKSIQINAVISRPRNQPLLRHFGPRNQRRPKIPNPGADDDPNAPGSPAPKVFSIGMENKHHQSYGQKMKNHRKRNML